MYVPLVVRWIGDVLEEKDLSVTSFLYYPSCSCCGGSGALLLLCGDQLYVLQMDILLRARNKEQMERSFFLACDNVCCGSDVSSAELTSMKIDERGTQVMVVFKTDTGSQVSIHDLPKVRCPSHPNRTKRVVGKSILLDADVIQAEFHPLSTHHVVVLTDDGGLRMFDTLGGEDELEVEYLLHDLLTGRVVSFAFGKPKGRSDRCISSFVELSLFLLLNDGSIFTLCPFVPHDFVIPSDLVDVLAEQLRKLRTPVSLSHSDRGRNFSLSRRFLEEHAQLRSHVQSNRLQPALQQLFLAEESSEQDGSKNFNFSSIISMCVETSSQYPFVLIRSDESQSLVDALLLIKEIYPLFHKASDPEIQMEVHKMKASFLRVSSVKVESASMRLESIPRWPETFCVTGSPGFYVVRISWLTMKLEHLSSESIGVENGDDVRVVSIPDGESALASVITDSIIPPFALLLSGDRDIRGAPLYSFFSREKYEESAVASESSRSELLTFQPGVDVMSELESMLDGLSLPHVKNVSKSVALSKTEVSQKVNGFAKEMQDFFEKSFQKMSSLLQQSCEDIIRRTSALRELVSKGKNEVDGIEECSEDLSKRLRECSETEVRIRDRMKLLIRQSSSDDREFYRDVLEIHRSRLPALKRQVNGLKVKQKSLSVGRTRLLLEAVPRDEIRSLKEEVEQCKLKLSEIHSVVHSRE